MRTGCNWIGQLPTRPATFTSTRSAQCTTTTTKSLRFTSIHSLESMFKTSTLISHQPANTLRSLHTSLPLSAMTSSKRPNFPTWKKNRKQWVREEYEEDYLEDQLKGPTPEEIEQEQQPWGESVAAFQEQQEFAIVHLGGRQWKVCNGDVIVADKLLGPEPGQEIFLDKVLLVGTKHWTAIGTPMLTNAKILALVEEQTLAEKVIIFKKRRRKHYKRHRGFRAQVTTLRIKQIIFDYDNYMTQRTTLGSIAFLPAPPHFPSLVEGAQQATATATPT